MPNYSTYVPVTGIIRSITPFSEECCSQLISLLTNDGIINFVSSPDTYVVNNTFLIPGMRVTAFYDSNLPVPMIFPPQYRAVVISPVSLQGQIAVNYFDENLLAADRSLQLNIGPNTNVVTANGQRYNCSIGGNTLIVFYNIATTSLPPQTTPRKIIVLC
ncbi:hypothetical protein [Luxibacter massiliensis]|uniref:hypothetical protein n=1 Tax=Luxibacter massiliensis TaxID=2219695 RepID=UPI000F06DAFE|nr:hypothetical protein [Luxibacter massiliensis]